MVGCYTDGKLQYYIQIEHIQVKIEARDITELLLKVASGIKHHKYHRVIGFRAIIDFHI
jgi:hypothetical protein